LKAGGALSDYLARWAEPVAEIASRVPGRYTHVLAVPALNESSALLDGYRAAAQAANGRVLCIVVVNASESLGAEAFEANARCLSELIERMHAVESLHQAPPVWFGSVDAFDVLLVDRNSPGSRLPKRQGVGLARRIGCDLAAALNARGTFVGRLIACTDADTILPADYFTRIDAVRNDASSALLFPFRHEPSGSESIDLATQLYELSLRYYVLGLAWAGSPYAFQSLGSSIALDVEAYAKVRGFPRLQAGEDFYVLCKLAKIAPLGRDRGEPIRIASRRSARVPFGTGAGVRKLEGRELSLYSPRSFAVLRAWLGCLNEFAKVRDYGRALSALNDLKSGERAVLDELLVHLDAQRTLEEASRATPGAGLLRRVHTWFDGFRTLKLIHALRDECLPDRGWAEALGSAPFIAPLELETSDPFTRCRALASLEEAATELVGPTLVG
jgi:hypothetical protein